MPSASKLSAAMSADRRTPPQVKPGSMNTGRTPRIGVIHNARARHNIGRDLPLVIDGCDRVIPRTHDELHSVLGSFVDKGIDTLLVEGGDGTVRDILSIIARHFPRFRPSMAIVPSGKTNALALDLGISSRWTLDDAVAAVATGRTAERTPIEIIRDGRVDLCGFIFGAGAYLRATKTAQGAHRIGAFNGLAVGMSIAAGVGQTVFGKPHNPWRSGEHMRLAWDAEEAVDGPQYLILASTLGRMPLRIKPFGQERLGMKMLRIDAPASHVLRALPAILTGAQWAWLERAGYHRHDMRQLQLSMEGGFVLDGETFPGGDLILRQGAPVAFVVP